MVHICSTKVRQKRDQLFESYGKISLWLKEGKEEAPN